MLNNNSTTSPNSYTADLTSSMPRMEVCYPDRGCSITSSTPTHSLANRTDLPPHHLASPQSYRSLATATVSHQGLGDTHSATNGQPFHCLTTQAPTDQGRPPPKSTHVDESTWQRWEEHQRQFAPWQYQPQYLTRYQDGPWQPITPIQRERLMGFPDDYTQPPHIPISDRSRNTWVIPGTCQQPSGCYSSFSALLRGLLSIQESDTPTSRRWQQCGTTPQSCGDLRHRLQNTTTCHKWIGLAIYIGPNNNISTANTHPHWIQLSIGRYITQATIPNINEVRHNISDELSHHRNLVPESPSILPESLQTTDHDHSDPSPTLPPTNHPISPRWHPVPWTHRWISPDRAPPARSQLESQTPSTPNTNHSQNYAPTTATMSWRSFTSIASMNTGRWWQTRSLRRSRWDEWMVHSLHQPGGTDQQ